MIKKYIIDGNNLIGFNPSLKKLQKSAPQQSREKLVLILSRFFRNKKQEVSLHFDGYPKETIPSGKIKITYSFDDTADEMIRTEIDLTKSPATIVLITSDEALKNYGRVNSCKVISSKEFWATINEEEKEDEEEKIQKEIDNEEILNLFLGNKKKSE